MNNFFNLRGLQKGRSKFDGWTIDPQALAHFNRVIADGGIVPTGLSGVNAFFKTVKSIYNTPDINSAISAAYDPHYLGYKLGAGSGTTLGQAARTLYSCSGASADVVQTTAASQPLLLAHTGENYWWGSGVTGNFVQTPNAAANNIINDFDIKITAAYIFNSTINSYIGKWDSGQQSWRLYLDTGNRLIWNIQGHALYPSNAINSTMNHLRVTRQASNGEIKYFFSTQALNTPIESITWTQLGTTQIGPTGSAPTTTSSLRIGQEQGNPFNGRIYRVTLANAIDGTPVVDFNPSSYNPSTSQTEWTSATGEVWTINTGTATSGYKGVLVNRSIVQGDGIDDGLVSGTISAVFTFSRFIAYNPFNKDLTVYVVDGNIQDRHSLYQSTTARFYNSGTGAGEVTTTLTSYRLQMLQGDYNGASSKASTNNGTENTGTVGNNSRTAVKIFGTISGVTPLNGIVNTLIDCSLVSGAQRTAMYNAIRGFNNNAF